MNNQQMITRESDFESIDIAKFIGVLWKRKFLILFLMVLMGVVGYIRSKNRPTYFYTESLFHIKEVEKSQGINLEGLSGVTGLLGGSLGVTNSNLSKLEAILRSRDLAKTVATKKNIIPDILEISQDSLSKSISDDSARIFIENTAADKLRKEILEIKVENTKGLITLGAKTLNGRFSKLIVEGYLKELNRRMKNDAERQLQQNISYLKDQSFKLADPDLREKINSLISLNVEKSMLLGNESLVILDPPTFPDKIIKENVPIKAMMYTVLGLVLGIIFSFGIEIGISIYYRMKELK